MLSKALSSFVLSHAAKSLRFKRTIIKHISAPIAAEPTQEPTIVPVPTTEPAALGLSVSDVSDSLVSAAAEEVSGALSASEEVLYVLLSEASAVLFGAA